MKRVLRASLIYVAAGLLAGIYFREFTRALDFTGTTMLSQVHPHLLTLGGIFPLVIELVAAQTKRSLTQMKWSYGFFNAGLGLSVLMMLIRGTMQVQGVNFTSGMNGMLAGFAGIGHAMLGISLVVMLYKLYKGQPG